MSRFGHRRRSEASHADDWLMTYADMITLLLCFFAIFLSVSIPKKDVKKIDLPQKAVQEPMHPPDVLKGDLPFYGLPPLSRPTEEGRDDNAKGDNEKNLVTSSVSPLSIPVLIQDRDHIVDTKGST